MRNPAFLSLCGGIGIAGALFPAAADIVSWFIAEGYSPISQTISSLAVGDTSWLMDLGLWVLALACFCIAAGMLAIGLSAGSWRLSAVATIAIGVEVAVIAMVNQYAGTETQGANVHTWAVYALYASFSASALAAAHGLRELHHASAAAYSRTAGWLWVVLGPVYYFWYPQNWTGAFERALAILLLSWLIVVAARLREEGRSLARVA